MYRKFLHLATAAVITAGVASASAAFAQTSAAPAPSPNAAGPMRRRRMGIRRTLTVAALAAGIGGLIMPALAQNRSGAGDAPDQGMSRSMDHRMMGGTMMRYEMMSGGCGGMMQSMNGRGRPNSQWQKHRPDNAKPD